jgi:hypothetical protein
MFQFFISALVTMLPDYLYRRYAQGKRLGKEITLYNFWYELRWGIIACAVLTLTLLLLGGGKETGSPMANVVNQNVSVDELPFFITAPGQTDGLLIAVALSDRLAKGATKVQLQIVGILGLISLFTFNNIYWVAGLILASVRLPDFITPLKEIASALSKSPTTKN